jgi:hypothetical protein
LSQDLQAHGLGALLTQNELCMGNFVNGVLEGAGRKVILTNGDVYDGQFRCGNFAERGVYFNNEENIWFYG